MDTVLRILVQVAIALACAWVATTLLPRRIPGGIFGLLVIGLAGVWLGEWALGLLTATYGFSFEPLEWAFQGVPLIPSILGSAVVLFAVTTFLSWGRYNR